MWVFGYGSLMWDPGFTPAERLPARLNGWHRSFCMRSIHYRGTLDRPGLVLALDRAEGASCAGIAFAVAEDEADAVLVCLRARELISDAYLETRLPVTLADGREVEALTYVIDRAHAQYARGLSPEDQARIIAHARGQNGANADYLWNTTTHLEDQGLADPDLDWLARRVRALLTPA
jgi:glutathione-specific gamma-glutamylcyclotransferase